MPEARFVDMLQALTDEIRHRSRHEHAERYDLIEGKLEGRTRDAAHLYSFRLPDSGRPGPSDVARLEIDSEFFAVDLLRVDAGSVFLASRAVLPASLDQATLVVTDTVILEINRDRLMSAVGGHLPGFNLRLAAAVIEPLQPLRTPRAEVEGSRAEGLNETQARVVSRARGAETLFVWGPAGTGKTRTLAAVISDRIAEKRTTLAVAPSNLAVDQLCQTVAARVAGDRLRAGAVVRFGDILDPSVPEDLKDLVSFDRIVARRRAPFLTRLEAAQVEYDTAIAARGVAHGDRPRARIGELHQEIRQLKHAIHLVPVEVMTGAVSVMTTVTRAALGQVGAGYDTVVIDEGGMVSCVDAVLVSGCGRRSVVVGGDFRQLGPVTAGHTASINRWLRQSPFEVTGASTCPDLDHTDRAACLRDQYRMSSDIQRLANAYAYRSLLRSARPDGALHELPQVGVVDTGPLALVTHQPRHGGRSNPGHAWVIARLLRETLAANPELCRRTDVGVVTPYRAQARVLRDTLARFEETSHVQVGTVHRFQGREKRVLILDLPDGPPRAPSFFMKASSLEHDGGRLLTVALTRAMDSFVLVGNLAYLESLPDGCVVRDLVRLIRELGHEIPVRQLGRAPLTRAV